MLLACLFLAALAHSYASPVPVTVPGGTIPGPAYIVAAAMGASQCDSTRTRTTFDILDSCIGVILLCTYISIHHNIPDQHDSRTRVMWLKIRMTLYALMAPEFMIIWAIRQRIAAGKIAEKNKHRRWTRTHGFFVQMGGLMQLQGDLTYKILCDEEDVEAAKIPHIPEKEIKDRGKGDFLAKALSLVITEIELVTLAFATLNLLTYGLWWDKPLNIEYPIYFDQEGIRTDGPLARTEELEKRDETQQGAWHKRIWKGTKDLTTRLAKTCLPVGREPGKLIMRTIVGSPSALLAAFLAVFDPLLDMMGEDGNANKSTSVHQFYAAKMNVKDTYLAAIYGSVVGIPFGAIHLIGWNFQSSTTTELWLWRSSSLALTITPLFLAIASAFFIAHEKLDVKILDHIGRAFLSSTGFVGAPIYFAARIILLFPAFFTLRALPGSAYQNVNWTEYFPHI
ncbi:hypothetical protein AX16_009427 [Volvariella volvacea WC 439]|nr:hypothetical protein AX16_009427 [Volvariella volvacea WC 439]